MYSIIRRLTWLRASRRRSASVCRRDQNEINSSAHVHFPERTRFDRASPIRSVIIRTCGCPSIFHLPRRTCRPSSTERLAISITSTSVRCSRRRSFSLTTLHSAARALGQQRSSIGTRCASNARTCIALIQPFVYPFL